MNTVHDCRLVDLPSIPRPEGSITPVEGGDTIPFEVARVYYVYDVVGGSQRGGHAHLELHQLIVSVMGAFTVIVDDGSERREIELNRAHVGLHIPPMIWRELVNFSGGAVSLVLASLPYSEADYVRDHDAFLELRR